MSRLPRAAAWLFALAVTALAPWPAQADLSDADPTASKVRTAYADGCGWTRERLSDPAWRPFLQPVADACAAVRDGGYLAESRAPYTAALMPEMATDFVLAVDRAARGLDALYLRLWRERLAGESGGTGVVALNDAGVFLALHHERVFERAGRLLRAHGLGRAHASFLTD